MGIDPLGRCRRCDGELWTLAVFYADSSLDIPLTVFLQFALGFGSAAYIDFMSVVVYPHVPSETVAKLNENPAKRLARVADFVRFADKEHLKSLGAIHCGACGILFVPLPGKPWCDEGYCSRVCLLEANPDSPALMRFEEIEPVARQSNTIQVACDAGHNFHVAKSFSGMVRPCPQCGTKTQVP